MDHSPDALLHVRRGSSNSCREVKPQAIFLRLDLIGERLTKSGPLCRVNQTLKHGFLHTLAVILATTGNMAEPLPTFCCFCVHIIGD